MRRISKERPITHYDALDGPHRDAYRDRSEVLIVYLCLALAACAVSLILYGIA